MSILDRIRSLISSFPFFNEVTRVARFVTVAGSGFTIPDPNAPLPVSDRHIQDIDAPGVVGNTFAVIFYRTDHTGSPTFTVRLNTTRLTAHAFGHPGPDSWHEVIPPGVLKAEDNELTLAVSGEGSVTFSDIVILYTSDQVKVKEEPVLTQG
jgi:hypothetical protein